MRTGFYWAVLVAVGLFSVLHPFGLHFASWSQPITGTDLLFYFLALWAIVEIAIREAANYVVKTLKRKV